MNSDVDLTNSVVPMQLLAAINQMHYVHNAGFTQSSKRLPECILQTAKTAFEGLRHGQ